MTMKSDDHLQCNDWSTATIAIIGGGPRGLAVAERIGVELQSDPAITPVRVVLIDDFQPGAGRIWRTDQNPHLLMNTVAAQVTIFSGLTDGGPARPGSGPSLYEWMRNKPRYSSVDRNAYVPRHVYGEYLRAALQVVVAGFSKPHTLEILRARVVDVVQLNPMHFRLEFAGHNRPLVVLAVVLATGHAASRPTIEEEGWMRFGEAKGCCHYYPADSAADLALADIPAGASVGVVGLGLGFHDILAMLTRGRGGRFEEREGRLRYLPSGREPKIVAGSRSGLPIPARGVNQKIPGHQAEPIFFHNAAIAAARLRAKSADGSPALSFRRDLLPLIQAEVDHVYYSTALRLSAGAETAAEFALQHAINREPYAPLALSLLRRYRLGDLPRLDLTALARPFDQAQFASPGVFRHAWRSHLENDLREALRGNVDSPLKAALDVLRDARDTLRSAVEFDGLTADSMDREFRGDFAPICSLLAAGPPAARVRELLALEESGFVRIVGPGLTIRCDTVEHCFRLSSLTVPAQCEAVEFLFDSRVPFPSLRNTRNPLLRVLWRRGLVRPYRQKGATDQRSISGGIDVEANSFRVVDRDGNCRSRVFAIGVPTESPRWFTQVGSGTPGVISSFTRDAAAVGRAVIGAINELRCKASTHSTGTLA
jgi:uncharacterized NAD(P)/FAD-binding protein YdhS